DCRATRCGQDESSVRSERDSAGVRVSAAQRVDRHRPAHHLIRVQPGRFVRGLRLEPLLADGDLVARYGPATREERENVSTGRELKRDAQLATQCRDFAYECSGLCVPDTELLLIACRGDESSFGRERDGWRLHPGNVDHHTAAVESWLAVLPDGADVI